MAPLILLIRQIFNFTPTLVSTSVHSDSAPSGWAGAAEEDLRFRLWKKGRHDMMQQLFSHLTENTFAVGKYHYTSSETK